MEELKFQPFYNKYYIKINKLNQIIEGWSNGPFPDKDTTDAICINEKGTYQFRLYPDGEENPLLFNFNRIPLYKYENKEIIPMSNIEIEIATIKQQNKNILFYQQQMIDKTKIDLANFLQTHPYKWKNNNYSVTEEKQALLTSQLVLYSMNNTAILYWNSIGQPCEIWSIEDLSALAEEISKYVRPYITYQQQKEVELRNCKTLEELNQVVVNYETLE